MSFDCFTYKIIAGGQIMNKKEDLAKANINWLITIYLTTLEFPLFTRLCEN